MLLALELNQVRKTEGAELAKRCICGERRKGREIRNKYDRSATKYAGLRPPRGPAPGPTKQPPSGEAAGWDSSRLASPGPPLPAAAARLLSAGTRARGPWKGHLPDRWGGWTPDPGPNWRLRLWKRETRNPATVLQTLVPFRLMRGRRELSYPACYPSLLTSAHLYSSLFLNASL